AGGHRRPRRAGGPDQGPGARALPHRQRGHGGLRRQPARVRARARPPRRAGLTARAPKLPEDAVRARPQALVPDHRDGGLRPATVAELAPEAGHTLPVADADELGQWFADAADSGSLERYLETFQHTVAVMQTAENLTRVARECVEDLVADGVVYA